MNEGAVSRTLPHRCNMCWKEGHSACYSTRCGHLFCEVCTYQHFCQSQSCPTCGFVLEETDMVEITLGLAPSSFRRTMFQEAFKEPNFHSSSQSALQMAELANETLGFIFSQILLESQRSAEASAQLKSEAAKLRQEQGRLTMKMRNQTVAAEDKQREMEHKLRLREKELLDLQEAYKEKNRKCLAWEKAYGNLRSQTTDPSRRGGFTPPESPRAGAMRGPPGSFAGSGGQRGSVQRHPSPRGSIGSSGGDCGGGIPRPGDRIGNTSPHSGNRSAAAFGGGSTGGSRSSWAMTRPTTSRGGSGGGGGGAAGDHVSPMLRPRQGQGFSSHAVTPSPTFASQQRTVGRFTAKRPETPAEVRGYYSSRNISPGRRLSRGGGGSGAGGGVGDRSGNFFPASKSELF